MLLVAIVIKEYHHIDWWPTLLIFKYKHHNICPTNIILLDGSDFWGIALAVHYIFSNFWSHSNFISLQLKWGMLSGKRRYGKWDTLNDVLFCLVLLFVVGVDFFSCLMLESAINFVGQLSSSPSNSVYI